MTSHQDAGDQQRPDAAFSVQSLLDVATAFADARVKYLIVGGLAVVAHGFLRMTQDVDLVLDFGNGNEQRAIAALQALGFRSRIPEPLAAFTDPARRAAWASDKDMVVLTVWKGGAPWPTEIDLFLDLPFDFAQAYAQALWKPGDERGVVLLPFVDYGNLLLMKRAAGRPRDLEDIRMLEALHQRRP